MATFRKRVDSKGAVSWQVMIRLRGHAPLSRTFAQKTDAKAWADEMEGSIRRGGTVSTEADRTTLDEALERYAREVSPLKKGHARELDRIEAWRKHDLAHKFLARLRGADFAEYRDERRAAGKAENTIRLELALISHLFKVAASDWGMESLKNPIKHVAMPAGSTPRERRLSADEEAALLPALAVVNPYLRPLTELALETAMRQGELLSLTWEDVDTKKRLARLRDTKNSEPRTVPLSTRAANVISALPTSVDRSAPLFPVSQDVVIRSFRAACKAAGIEGLRFHDVRHEAVSRLFERGLGIQEVAAISGHKTWSQLKRYTHPQAEALAKKLG